MKVTKDRNPYLRRASSLIPHTYSFQMDSGKYFLHSQDGSRKPINKTGTHQSKFKRNFSGIATPKQRYSLAEDNQSYMPFVPDFSLNKNTAYYTPVTRKFVGYAQLPYTHKEKQLPDFLSNPDEPHKFLQSHRKARRSMDQHSNKKEGRSESIIFRNTQMTFKQENVPDQFFRMSFTAISESKPMPRQIKKSCYSYRCKQGKNFYSNDMNTTQSTAFSKNQAMKTQIISKSFYDKQLALQKQQLIKVA